MAKPSKKPKPSEPTEPAKPSAPREPTRQSLHRARAQATTDAYQNGQRYCLDCKAPLNYSRGNVPNSVSTRLGDNHTIVVVCDRCRKAWERELLEAHTNASRTSTKDPDFTGHRTRSPGA